MEEDLLEFLRKRNVSATTLQALENEKMDSETISKASLEILTPYFPTLGDCLAAKNFCIKKTEGLQRKMGMVELIKKKMAKKRKRRNSSSSEDEKGSLLGPVTRKTQKETRQVWVGWLCSLNGERHKQVRLKHGGGTRKLTINKTAKYEEIMAESKKNFFKDGTSSKGREENFSFAMWDYQQNSLGDLTVDKMFKISGLTRLRFYIVSTEKTCTISASCQSPIPEYDLITTSSTVQSTSESEDRRALQFMSFVESEDEWVSISHPVEDELPPISHPVEDDFPQFSCVTENDELTLLVNSIFEESPDEVLIQFTLKDILADLQSHLKFQKISKFNVFRNDVFQCCIRALRRKDFDPSNKLYVKFSDIEGLSEGAIDEGGPTREMFRLVLSEIKYSNLFTGTKRKHISLNNNSLREKHYLEAGRIISLSLLHGGPGPHFISKTLFSLISKGIDNTEIEIEDLEEEIRTKLCLFERENSLNKLQEMILEDTVFSTAGCHYIDSIDKKTIVIKVDVLRFYGYQRIEEPLKQFLEGLNMGGVLKKITEYPDLFEPVFCQEKVPVNSDTFETLFKQIEFSESGSNKRMLENRAISYFRDYVLDCEENENGGVSVTDILVFATGADIIPPLGFPVQPKITFNHSERKYPTANTCAIELRVPTSHIEYKEFKDSMDFALENSKTFGLP